MNGYDTSPQKLSRILLSDLTCIASNTRSLKLSSGEIQLVPGIAQVGSVVVCKVVSVDAHKQVENRSGRIVRIIPGDLIMGVIGHRHSTTSMYGGVPKSGVEVPTQETFDLLSSGGVIGICHSSPSFLGNPTKLHILGLASQGGKLLEIKPQLMDKQLDISCPIVLIVGTSANVGKSRFATKLIHFISHVLGRQVAATKLAGVGNLDDTLNFMEAGAIYTFDFVEAGLVTTYGVSAELVVMVAKGILNYLGKKKPEVIIAELSGDILGGNVPAILADREICEAASAMILVPSDTFAASGALKYLAERGC